MDKKFKLNFKKWHVIVMIASLLLASGSMILQSELETHALNVDTTLGILPG
jgi:hypothetical protein